MIAAMNCIKTCCCPTEKQYEGEGKKATRIATFVFLAIEAVGFVLSAVAFRTPPPFHMLTGLYVILGGMIAFPIALAIITREP